MPQIGLIFIIALMAIGCYESKKGDPIPPPYQDQPKSDSPSASNPVAGDINAFQKRLDGQWVSPCRQDDTSGWYKTYVTIYNLDDPNRNEAYTQQHYSDSKCELMSFSINYFYAYTVGPLVFNNDSIHEYNLTLKKYEIAINDPDMVDKANKQAWLGYTNWQVALPNSIADKGSVSNFPESLDTHKTGEKFYTIVKVEGNQMIMGYKLAEKPEDRPPTFDPVPLNRLESVTSAISSGSLNISQKENVDIVDPVEVE